MQNFVGSSHPELGQLVCDRLGVEPAPCTLKKFSNGETSVQIGVSLEMKMSILFKVDHHTLMTI